MMTGGACLGDGGGPLTHAKDNRTHYLVGGVSLGSCGGSGYPDIYAEVPEYMDWIEKTIFDNGGATYCLPVDKKKEYINKIINKKKSFWIF